MCCFAPRIGLTLLLSAQRAFVSAAVQILFVYSAEVGETVSVFMNFVKGENCDGKGAFCDRTLKV